MNLFKYTAAVAQLREAKLVSQVEGLVRKYHDYVPKYHFSKDPSTEAKLYYKLFVLGLNRHYELSNATLPDFIHNAKVISEQVFLNSMFNNACTTYDDLMDLFEFNSVVSMPSATDLIEPLDKIVGNNPIHFHLIWNRWKDTFESCSTDLEGYTQEYLSILRYKQVHYGTSKRTVLDKYLSEHRSIVSGKVEEFEAAALKLKQHIKAINTLKKDMYE